MIRSLLLLVIMLSAGHTARAQITFIAHFDSVAMGRPGTAFGIEETSTGYLVTGLQSSHDAYGRTHVFVRTTDAYGQVTGERELWHGHDTIYNQGGIDPLCVDGAGFAGPLTSYDPVLFNQVGLWLVKYNEQGDTTYCSKVLQFEHADSIRINIHQMIKTSDNGYAMAGWWNKQDELAWAWLVRLNEFGDTLWTRKYGVSSELGEIYSLAEYPDGGLVLCGIRLLPYIDNNHFLIRTDAQGNQLWRRQFGNFTPGAYSAVRVAPDSSIITWTDFRDWGWGFTEDVLDIRKWDPLGFLVWSKKTNHRSQPMVPIDLEVLSDGSFAAGSMYWGMAGIFHFSPQGDSLWLRRYLAFTGAGGGTTEMFDLLPTSDGGFAICGRAQQGQGDPTPGLWTMFIIKTDSLGCVVPGCHLVGVPEYEITLQEHLHLWPNPASDLLHLHLPLPPHYPLQGHVTLRLLDAAGRTALVHTLPPGTELRHTLPLHGLAPGLYHLHLSDEHRWLAGGRVVVGGW